MRRRSFLRILVTGTIGWPLAAWPQSTDVPIVGFLNPAAVDEAEKEPVKSHLAAFRQGLAAHGYVEDKNVRVEYHWAGDVAHLRQHAADLVRPEIALIVATGGTVAARAARSATQTKPIVFLIGGDPVGEGLVSSINRPGGNATGMTLVSDDILEKRIELLQELTRTSKIVVLVDPRTSTAQSEIERARSLESRPVLLEGGQHAPLQVILLEASTEKQIADAFASAREAKAGGLIVTPGAFYTTSARRIVSLAQTNKIPTGYPWRIYATLGGLMSYGAKLTDAYRLVGEYAGTILKGAKPQDLPVRTPVIFELVLNKITATALDLKLPESLLVAATDVIE